MTHSSKDHIDTMDVEAWRANQEALELERSLKDEVDKIRQVLAENAPMPETAPTRATRTTWQAILVSKTAIRPFWPEPCQHLVRFPAPLLED